MKSKIHLSIDGQIKLLLKRNLIINDIKKAKSYLSKYNYQWLINGYNAPFMKNFNKNTNWYDYGSSFESIIELMYNDVELSSNILKSIQFIEKEFAAKISFYVSSKLFSLNKKDGKIYDLNDKLFNSIFISKNKNKIFEITSKCINKNNELFVKYNNKNGIDYKNIPVWISSLSWTFGTTIKIFKSLNKELQYKIIRSYENISWNSSHFISIMEILKIIRNNIAHNRTIYNFNIRRKNEIIRDFARKIKLQFKIIFRI